jgi:cytochrome c
LDLRAVATSLLIVAVVVFGATSCSRREDESSTFAKATVDKKNAPGLPPVPAYEAHVFAGGVPPPSAGPRKPHVPKAEHATAGARLFTSMNCDGCHGGGATGWVGPSLVDGRWRYGGTDEEVFDSIFYGRPKGMPAYGGVLGAEGVWMIVSYFKAQPVPSVVPTTSYENTDGHAGAAPAVGAASAPARLPAEASAKVGEPLAGEPAHRSLRESQGTQAKVGRAGVEGMLAKYACTACHTVDMKVIGPSFAEVAAKYRGQKDVPQKLVEKVRNGGSGAWGPIPMPPNPNLPDKDLHTIIEWILALR